MARYIPPVEEATCDFAASAENVRAARHFVADVAQLWDLGDLEWPLVQIVSELASNAIIHAGTAFTVRVSRDADTTKIEVLDGSPRRAQSRHYGLDATTGRGLHLVERLSREWGVSSDAKGKVVWAVVDAAASRGDEPDAPSEIFLGADDDIDDAAWSAVSLHDDPGPRAAARLIA